MKNKDRTKRKSWTQWASQQPGSYNRAFARRVLGTDLRNVLNFTQFRKAQGL